MPLKGPFAISLIVFTGYFAFGQAAARVSAKDVAASGVLQITKTVPSKDIATTFESPVQCDDDGNVYSKTDSDGFPAIHKLSPKGERTASFVPSSCSDIKVQRAGQFFVAPDGRVYQVAFPLGDKPHVLVFDDDGACDSKIKLGTPFAFMPYQLVTFPSGNMMISGARWKAQLKRSVRYTALFSSDGTILKEVDFDREPTAPTDGNGTGSVKETEQEQNHSLARGAMLLAADNNAYLMRSGPVATIYAISEGGSVVRSFRVDSEEPDVVAQGMHIAGNRIAVLFGAPHGSHVLIKVVDLEGKPLAQYEAPTQYGRSTLGAVFACYSYPPEDFTFLSTTADEKVVLKTIEPR